METNADPKKISFTADNHTFFRTLYDLPYTLEIYDFMKTNIEFKPTTLAIVPIFEARYKGTDAVIKKYIEEKGIKQILSLAAGMEQRSIALVSKYPNLIYVETDISDIFQKKSELVNSIFKKYKLKNRENLHFINTNILDKEQLENTLKYFALNEPILIVNEGLLSYYSEEENSIIIQNIKDILKKFGGFWVTSDPSMTRQGRANLFSHSEKSKEILKNLGNLTGRNYDEKGFENENEIENFIVNKGFTIKKYNQKELNYELCSLNKINLDKSIQIELEKKIKDNMLVWAMILK